MTTTRNETRPSSRAPSGARLALVALALGSFAIGCTEFVVVGLLPQIATDLGQPEGVVGQLVTLNAVAVAVAAPLIGAAVARRPARPVLGWTLVLFAVAHLMAAAAPNFTVLLASRILTGAAFGLYLSVAFGAAARLADSSTRARALATVQGGITTATALGVPMGMILGNAVGSTAGWRIPFLAIGALAAVAALAVRLTVPALAPQGAEEQSVRARLTVLGRRPVAWGIATIAVFWSGSFCAFTYLLPLLTGPTGLDVGAAAGVLLMAGVLSVVGNVLGGRGADRALSATLVTTAAVTAAGIVLLHVTASVPVLAIAMLGIWQLAAWSFVPAVQNAIFELGGNAGEAALSFSVAAFNVGIVLGAGAGGVALEQGGNPAVGVTAAVLAVIALAMTMYVVRLRRSGVPQRPAEPGTTMSS